MPTPSSIASVMPTDAMRTHIFRTVLPGLLLASLAATPAAAQYSGFNGGLRLGAVFTSLESDPAGDAASSIDFDSATGIAMDLGYEIRQGLEVELILSTAPHDLSTAGGQFPGRDAGTLWIAPVTLTMRYTIPLRHPVQPFVGGGVGWAWAHSYDGSRDFEELGIRKVDLDADPGLVLHAGVEYDESDRWYWIFDLRYFDVGGTLDIRTVDGSVYDTPDASGHQILLNLGAGMRF